MAKILLFSLLIFGSLSFPSPLIISHRGASFWAPEETKAAYLLAAKLGGDFWEMDIQRTKDGVLVALHDLDLRRTSDIGLVHPNRKSDPVGSFTWAELQLLDFGSWFNQKYPKRFRPNFKGLKILSLEEIIDLADSIHYTGGLYIETKNAERYPGMEKQIISLLEKKGWLDQNAVALKPVVFQTFSKPSILKFKKLAPHVRRTYLVEDVLEGSWKSDLNFALQNGCIVGPDFRMVKRAEVKQEIKMSGIEVHPWTIDGQKEMGAAQKLNLAGIFTNRTDLAIVLYRNSPPPLMNSLLSEIGY